ncbi:hypothetical protein FVE85_0103 [Porphyridium purpureum]|uniref:Uncharacterized protein n=1 Tax=Porphyridium purpureum TaxID=35688 RepID=A0A5J4Z071_PORPP|nr:hypothetical protein FVE85_0103 [Porphyridium purpureum]|eukprot:POR4316..scf208_2
MSGRGSGPRRAMMATPLKEVQDKLDLYKRKHAVATRAGAARLFEEDVDPHTLVTPMRQMSLRAVASESAASAIEKCARRATSTPNTVGKAAADWRAKTMDSAHSDAENPWHVFIKYSTLDAFYSSLSPRNESATSKFRSVLPEPEIKTYDKENERRAIRTSKLFDDTEDTLPVDSPASVAKSWLPKREHRAKSPEATPSRAQSKQEDPPPPPRQHSMDPRPVQKSPRAVKDAVSRDIGAKTTSPQSGSMERKRAGRGEVTSILPARANISPTLSPAPYHSPKTVENVSPLAYPKRSAPVQPVAHDKLRALVLGALTRFRLRSKRGIELVNRAREVERTIHELQGKGDESELEDTLMLSLHKDLCLNKQNVYTLVTEGERAEREQTLNGSRMLLESRRMSIGVTPARGTPFSGSNAKAALATPSRATPQIDKGAKVEEAHRASLADGTSSASPEDVQMHDLTQEVPPTTKRQFLRRKSISVLPDQAPDWSSMPVNSKHISAAASAAAGAASGSSTSRVRGNASRRESLVDSSASRGVSTRTTSKSNEVAGTTTRRASTVGASATAPYQQPSVPVSRRTSLAPSGASSQNAAKSGRPSVGVSAQTGSAAAISGSSAANVRHQSHRQLSMVKTSGVDSSKSNGYAEMTTSTQTPAGNDGVVSSRRMSSQLLPPKVSHNRVARSYKENIP